MKRPGSATAHPLYSTWVGMRRRCRNHTDANRAAYGPRGIKVCERWEHSFRAFVEDMGPKPDGTTLDRINNDGDYEPGNCRWATHFQQASNKRQNVYLTINGETRCLMEWSRIYGVQYHNALRRLRRGWPIDQIFAPLKKRAGPRYITLNGETLRVAEWVRKLGLCDKTVRYRLLVGWPPDKALTVPVGPVRDHRTGQYLSMREGRI